MRRRVRIDRLYQCGGAMGLALPRFARLADDSPGHIRFGGEQFTEVTFASLLGFYDWSRTPGVHRIVGLTLTLHREADGLQALLPPRDYLNWVPGILTLDFTVPASTVDYSVSCDQEFSASRAFRSKSDRWCLLFDAALVPERELVRLVGS